MYVYRQVDTHWEVGYWKPEVLDNDWRSTYWEWETESKHPTQRAAVDRLRYLNGAEVRVNDL